ncbi:MAG: trehalose-phosphatase [Chitinispirillales bacterium]|jgi:alpha,alpha-trehalase|nr:trehalose-phosphatase [Chitinispirillales bacterium]
MRNLARIGAVVLDLDGVLTSTAILHARAWKRMFDGFLKNYSERTGTSFVPLDEKADYREFIDGRPRSEGASGFLRSRGINLTFGEESDPPDKETVCGLGNLKDHIFLSLLREHKASVYEDALRMVQLWRSAGLRLAVVSASKNAREVLNSLGIEPFFDVIVDGNDALLNKLKGKPEPDTFLFAAKLLGITPSRCAVIEDAFAGVKAGSLGGFSLVTGVSRDGGRSELFIANGANLVVTSLDQIPPLGILLKQSADKIPSAVIFFKSLSKNLSPENILVCLDYDGTLTPIVQRPQDARLSLRMRNIISVLSESAKVAVISGRDMEDLRHLVNIDNIFYSGSHGFEIAGPGGIKMEFEEAMASKSSLRRAGEDLQNLLSEINGVFIERKKFGLAVHYRLADQQNISKIKDTVQDVAAAYSELRITHGKMVIDLRPALSWDKGMAVRWITKKLFGVNQNKAYPLYIGDDITDEDAFGEVKDWGTGILVGNHNEPSFADYSLESPDQVQIFLEMLNAELKTK